MDVDAMDELMYDTLIRYFKTLAHTGYKSYDVVFKMLVMDFIYEITHTELRYYITNKDIKLMQDLLYQFLGSTCEISFPTNNRNCCICYCNGDNTPPPVVPTTTTSTKPPVQEVSVTLTSNAAQNAYVNGALVAMGTKITAKIGSTLTITAVDVEGYSFSGFYSGGSPISGGNNKTLQYTVPSTDKYVTLIYNKDTEDSSTTTTSTSSPASISSTTTTSSTSSPSKYYRVTLSSNVDCNIKGSFGGVSIDSRVISHPHQISIERTSVPSGTITSCSAVDGSRFMALHDEYDTLIAASLPYTWVGNKELKFEFEETATTTTSSTVNPLNPTTTSSTTPPVKTATVIFKCDSRTTYTVTYNTSNKLRVLSSKDGEVKVTFPSGVSGDMPFIINSITCENSYDCSSISEGALPYTIMIAPDQRVTVTPVIVPHGEGGDGSTTTTSSSNPPPVLSNSIYYGLLVENIGLATLRDMPLETMMKRSETKSKNIIGTGVNEYALPQGGELFYLIIPRDKVQLIHAEYVSGGQISVFYDSVKEDIPGDTNNGFCYSKYTRSGKNANPGGTYNGIYYDVYFANASGGDDTPLNIQAKNK